MSAVMNEFYDGPHATPPLASDGPIYLGIKNITEDGRLDLSKVRHISWDDFPKWTKRVEPRPGDLVFTYEASLHRYALIPLGFKGCLGRRVALIRPDRSKVHPRFLLYYFISPHWRATVTSRINIGSTVDRIPLIEFPNFPVELPTLDTQEKIATTLSAYDELIEDNLRRIEILEEMAQAIYREWFVNFGILQTEGDFQLTSSELGQIPAAWSVARTGERFEVSLGGTPARNKPEYWAGDIPWINSSSLNRVRVTQGVQFITKEALAKSNTKLWPKGSVLIAITGATLGQVSRLEIDSCANQSVVGVWDPKDEANEFLYLALSNRIGALIAHASGSAQQHINKAAVERFPILLPPPDVIQNFGTRVRPTFELLANLLHQNDTLRRTRDFLLPRLISGEIDVSELDIETSWLAA